MTTFINKIADKIVGKQRKFFPVLDERGLAQKPLKFVFITEREWILQQRQRGVFGNGNCLEEDF